MNIKKIHDRRFLTVKADDTYTEESSCIGKNDAYKIIVDTRTGVNYLIIGCAPNRTITPILDSDGKPLIDFWGLPQT